MTLASESPNPSVNFKIISPLLMLRCSYAGAMLHISTGSSSMSTHHGRAVTLKISSASNTIKLAHSALCTGSGQRMMYENM
jgi:hypothetical protein